MSKETQTVKQEVRIRKWEAEIALFSKFINREKRCFVIEYDVCVKMI